MKKLFIRVVIVAAMFLATVYFQTIIFSQTKPLTLDQISRAISTFSKDKKLLKKIIVDVRNRGVDFSLTAENEGRLRREGATDELIDAMKENSPSLPKPVEASLTTKTETPISSPKPDYSVYLESGDEFFNKFDFDKATEQYTKVLELDPQNVYALIQRGYARHYTGDSTNDFLADYNSAIKIDSNLALKPNMICVLSDTSQSNADNAIEACSKALSAKPKFSLFYYKRGNAYRQKREWAGAINDYSEAINLFPNFYSAFVNRGIAFDSAQNIEKALADFDKAISIKPNKIPGYSARGRLYASAKPEYDKALADFNYAKPEYDKALADFNKVIELDSKNVSAYLERGQLYFTKKRNFDKAIADFNKALELDSKNIAAYRMRGQFYIYKNRDYDKAFADFDKAIEVDSKNASAYLTRGENYYNRALENNSRYTSGGFHWQTKEYFNRAKTDFDKAVELNPDYSAQVAVRYVTMGTISQSVADFTKAIELDPNSFNAYFQRGRTFKNKRDYDKAIADFDKAIEINPNSSSAFAERGLMYFYKQNYDIALADYNRSIEIYRQDSTPYRGRANVYDKMGKKDLAEQDRKRADILVGKQ